LESATDVQKIQGCQNGRLFGSAIFRQIETSAHELAYSLVTVILRRDGVEQSPYSDSRKTAEILSGKTNRTTVRRLDLSDFSRGFSNISAFPGFLGKKAANLTQAKHSLRSQHFNESFLLAVCSP